MAGRISRRRRSAGGWTGPRIPKAHPHVPVFLDNALKFCLGEAWMTLEAAAVAVGKTLGKHLAQAWLAGRSGEQDRRKELTELIQARFPDRIARRRFERQVADVADQVAERLLTMCGHEYGGLS